MLHSLNSLEHYAVSATDGPIGKAVNFLFDDERWAVRYLVVDTKGFLKGRQVLISPISINDAQWPSKLITLALTKDKVQHSPGVEVDQPVSRQQEALQNGYYGYPAYWGYTGGLWGLGPSPALLRTANWQDTPPRNEPSQSKGDRHLRSAREVRGYHLEGNDGAIGHVSDFIVDDESWALRYLVIETGSWWAGKKVVIAPDWASQINWAERSIRVGLTRQAIQDSPVWNGTGPVNREYEQLLFEYYGRPAYWAIRANPEIALRMIPPPPPPT